MGGLLPKLGEEDINTLTDKMNSRNAWYNPLRRSQRNLPGSVKSVQEQEPTLGVKAGNNDMSKNKRYPCAEADLKKSNKQQVINKIAELDSASIILDDMKQGYSFLSSIEERIKNSAFSTNQGNELNELLERTQNVIERISCTMRTKHYSPTLDPVVSICHTDTGNTNKLTKIAISDSKDNAFGSHQDNESSQLVDRNKVTCNVEQGLCESGKISSEVQESVTKNTKDHNKSLAIGTRSGCYQSEQFLDFCKIKSYMKNLNIEKVEDETAVIENLKKFKKHLLELKGSKHNIKPILLNVIAALTKIQRIKKQKEINLHSKLEEMQDNTEHLETFCDKGKSDNCELGMSYFKTFSLAKEEMELKEKETPLNSKHYSTRLNEHPYIAENACRDEMKKMNIDDSRSINENIHIENTLKTRETVQKLLDKSKYGDIDDNCICTAEQCECPRKEKCQETDSISFEEKKQCDDKRSRDENRLKQIENRRNEIKSEIDCFVGTNSDPKFQELNEYSVRLLLEMDDLILPKGSDLHKRKRELLKEVYQYSDILEDKAKNFEYLAEVENNINYISYHLNNLKKSRDVLNKFADYIKCTKSKLYKEDYENLLRDRKQWCIQELDGLEGAVNFIMRQENTKLSLKSKSKEIVEDLTHSSEPKSASGDISTNVNSSTSNNGFNRNENVVIVPKNCNEHSQRIDNESNETKESIHDQTILARQEKGRIKDSSTARDENLVGPSNQLQIIEVQSDDSHSGRDVTINENISTETELDDIDSNVFDVIKKIHLFDEYSTSEEYHVLKDDLLREHSKLNEYNFESEVCEAILKRRRLINKEIFHWLDYLEQQIQALLSINCVEVEIGRIFQIINGIITQEDVPVLRETLIHLGNTLQQIRSNDGRHTKRMEKCHKYIQLYLNTIDEKTKIRNFDTTV